MSNRNCLSIILAAGEGTRMKSQLPKVMHEIANTPMLGHVLQSANEAGSDKLAVVIGPSADKVEKFLLKTGLNLEVFTQTERLGTAHATLQAKEAITQEFSDVLVMFGDTPLITSETLNRMRGDLAGGAGLVVLGFKPDDPYGYGRLLLDQNGFLTAIREHKDASEEELQVGLCNAGVMAFAGSHILAILDQISNSNANEEFYLTDAVEIARSMDLKVKVVIGSSEEVLGVNNRLQLSQAEGIFQSRLREAAMLSGVTMTAPESVMLSNDTVFGTDVTIEPNVVIGPGVSIASNATIKAFSHLEQTSVGEGAIVGPYARLRPGAVIGEKAKVGNFVEIKKSEVGVGAKVNHLSYIGDSRVGDGANIGAGTITCNYDGFNKSKTIIGAGAFIGSNSSLVAPVAIKDGAYVGSGSVVTKDVDEDALAVTRPKQTNIAGWAKKFRERSGA